MYGHYACSCQGRFDRTPRHPFTNSHATDLNKASATAVGGLLFRQLRNNDNLLGPSSYEHHQRVSTASRSSIATIISTITLISSTYANQHHHITTVIVHPSRSYSSQRTTTGTSTNSTPQREKQRDDSIDNNSVCSCSSSCKRGLRTSDLHVSAPQESRGAGEGGSNGRRRPHNLRL